jgi:hypothetical protein
VKGRIGAESLLQGARVARIAECRLEQKVGYDRHTDHPQGYSDQFLQNIDSKIFKVLWEMKKNGLKEETIKNNRKLLTYLSKHVDLEKPEDVKGFIADLDKADSYKRNLSLAYWNYTKVFGFSWEKPKYYQSNRLPQISP